MALDKKAYEQAQKAAAELMKTQKGIEESANRMTNMWGGIAQSIFGIDKSNFFKQIPKTTEEILIQKKEFEKIQGKIDEIGKSVKDLINKDLSNVSWSKNQKAALSDFQKYHKGVTGSISDELNKLGGIEIFKDDQGLKNISKILKENVGKEFNKIKDTNKDLKKLLEGVGKDDLSKIENTFKNISKLSRGEKEVWDNVKTSYKGLGQISNERMAKELALGLAQKDLTKFLKEYGIEGVKALKNIRGIKDGTIGAAHGLVLTVEEAKSLEAELSKANKSTFSLSKGFDRIGDNLRRKIIDKILEFDEVVSKSQRDTGIQFKENAAAMSQLTSKAAAFGMTIEDTAQTFALLADEIRTTDFRTLAGFAENMIAVKGATGASLENITHLAGQMAIVGASGENVNQMFEDANAQSRMFGVNTRRVIEGMSRNFEKMRLLGFTGGEKSLLKMTIMAEKLRVNTDSIFNVAENLRSLEGSMEAAATLQLAGIQSVANPMELLAASRKGPEETLKLIKNMGTELGSFNKESGRVDFGPIARDQAKLMSEALNLPLQEVMNMITSTGELEEKIKGISPDVFKGLTDGVEAVDEDLAKSTVGDMMKWDKAGKKFVVKSEAQKIFDEAGVKDLNNITQKQLQTILEKKRIDSENLAKQAEANASLKESFNRLINGLLTVFGVFEPAISGLATIVGGIAKWVSELGTGAKLFLSGILLFGLYSSKFGGFISSFVGGIGNLVKAGASKIFGGGGGAGAAGGKGFAFGDNIAKAGSQIKTGVGGVTKMLSGIFGELTSFLSSVLTNIVKLVADVAKSLVDGVASLMPGLNTIAGGIRKIVANLVGIVTDSFVSLMRALGTGITVFAAAAASGFAMLTPFIPIILVLTAAFIGFGFGMKLLLEGIGAAAPAITAILEGLGTVIESIGTAISIVITSIADSIFKLANIDAMKLFALAGGIAALSLAFVAFGAASLGGGIMSAIGGLFGGDMFEKLDKLASLAAPISVIGTVMSSLSTSLNEASNAMNTFSEATVKLNTAIETLNTEKLEKLKELSDSFAKNTVASGISNVMNAFAAKLGGGKEGGTATGKGGKKELTINLKMNGKDIQKIIVEDTDLLS